MRLLYVADPMCSWCYGFGPELAKLLARHPDAELDLAMGGLRPFNKEPATAQFREMLREHWRHVSTASGLPFSEAALDRSGFIYDTEPACRAVVTARALDAARAYPYLKAIQAAFYRDGRDMTDQEALADVAAECGYDHANFLAHLKSEAMRDAVREEFASVQSMGVSGFPTVGVARGPQIYLVTSGYVGTEEMQKRLDQIERMTAEKAVR